MSAAQQQHGAEARVRPARLPWWALALPVVPFAALLAVMVSATGAGATEAPRSPEILLGLLARLLGAGA